MAQSESSARFPKSPAQSAQVRWCRPFPFDAHAAARSFDFDHAFTRGGRLWSEKLDADTVEWFKENGGLKRENGNKFSAALLSRGGSMDAMQMFRNLTGHAPDISHVLKRRGLDGTAPTEVPPPNSTTN